MRKSENTGANEASSNAAGAIFDGEALVIDPIKSPRVISKSKSVRIAIAFPLIDIASLLDVIALAAIAGMVLIDVALLIP